jgi:predicted permease
MGNWGNLPLAVISSLDTPLFTAEDKEIGVALIVSFIGLGNLYFFTLGHIGTELDSKWKKEEDSGDDEECVELPVQEAESTLVPVEHVKDPGVFTVLLQRGRDIVHKTNNRRMIFDAFTHPSFQAVLSRV